MTKWQGLGECWWDGMGRAEGNKGEKKGSSRVNKIYLKNKIKFLCKEKQSNLKNKLSKQEEQRQYCGNGEHFDGFQMRGGCGEMGEEYRD